MATEREPEPLSEAVLRSYAPDPRPYRSAPTTWIDELDDRTVHVGPPHQRMSTRLIDAEDWLLVDDHRPGELALRARLLRDRRADVFAAEPGAQAACEELNELIDRWVSARALPGPGGDDHPLAAAGLAVQEDLCIMQRDAEGWRLTAAMLCFPTHWRLADKLGHVQERIHGPVPHYRSDLAPTVNRFFDRLAPDRVMARRNWGFTPDALLFRPDASLVDGPTIDPPVLDPEVFWLRSERQTLRRLAAGSAIVFTIRIQLAPLAALRSHPVVASRLAAAMRAWSPEISAGRRGHLDGLVPWLEQVVSQA